MAVPLASAASPKTLSDAIEYFAVRNRADNFVAALRWPAGQMCCPRCHRTRHCFLANRRVWRCLACGRQFSLKVGTIFEDSPLPLSKWLPAVWTLAEGKRAPSSYELARAIGVTQKTAWFMLHRIRFAMEATRLLDRAASDRPRATRREPLAGLSHFTKAILQMQRSKSV